jgi:hypothetical protein
LPACRGQRFPDASHAVTGADADQASTAVLAAKYRGLTQQISKLNRLYRGPYRNKAIAVKPNQQA